MKPDIFVDFYNPPRIKISSSGSLKTKDKTQHNSAYICQGQKF